MRILAVGAHPDDVELTCAGTLAKYRKQGDDIFIAIATNGEVGSEKIPKKELIEIRRSEAKAAASVIDAEVIWMGYKDQFLFNDEDTRKHMIDVIRQTRPDVIFSPSPFDYHSDHITTSRLCIDARTMASIKLIETEYKPCEKIPHLYFTDTENSQFIPEEFVDISDTISIKKEMLSKHKTQIEFMKRIWDMDFMDFVDFTAKYRGYQAGLKYAEAFRNVNLHPRVTNKSLLP